MAGPNSHPYCCDTRVCFAAHYNKKGDRTCKELVDTYDADGDCPFCKPTRTITNGKIYPYTKRYNA